MAGDGEGRIEEDTTDVPTERKIHPRNTLNDLDGEHFLYATKSVLATSYRSAWSHELRKDHGANKPPQLMAQLIETFTKTGMWVLDPFAGVGGTLIGASIALPGPRRCVGIEINPSWTAVYGQVLVAHPDLEPQTLVVGDCLAVMDSWLVNGDRPTNGHPPDGLFDFIATDPPYNIHIPQTMSGAGGERWGAEHRNRRSIYNMRSDQAEDLANLGSYAEYLDAMEAVFRRCVRLLRPGRYMAVIVRDAYQNGRYLFTHADLAGRATQAGFIPKGEIIWYQAGSKLRPYGYPSSFVPNIVHQHIVVFQRPKGAERGKGRRA